MVYLIGLLLFGLLAVLQGTIVSAMPLLKGTADLFLLFIVAWALQDRVESAWQWCLIGGVLASIYSGLPFGVFILAYLICVGVARLIKRYIWKAPFLAMLEVNPLDGWDRFASEFPMCLLAGSMVPNPLVLESRKWFETNLECP